MAQNNSTQQPDQRQCPLCGGDNNCALANGRPMETCWCQNAQLKDSALTAIPENERNVRCICPACGLNTKEAKT